MENLFNSFVQSMRVFSSFKLKADKQLRLIGIVDTERAIMNEAKNDKHTIMINRININTYESALQKAINGCENFAKEKLEGSKKDKLLKLIEQYENKYHEIKNEDMARQIYDERVMVNE